MEKEVIDITNENPNPTVENWDNNGDGVVDIESLIKERDEYADKYLRILADCDNIRKRDNEVIKNLRENANENILKSLLDTIDNFERAFANYTENAQKLTKKGIEILEGMSNIYRGFCTTLRSYGLAAINISIGDSFDTNTMEAVSIVPGDGENIVEHIICKGYTYNGKVIRYAKVIVKQ